MYAKVDSDSDTRPVPGNNTALTQRCKSRQAHDSVGCYLPAHVPASPPSADPMIYARSCRYMVMGCVCLLGACGKANESEVPASGADTRYEIVIVDSSGQQIEDGRRSTGQGSIAQPAPQLPSAPETASAPPPPGIDDEAGGDGLLAYDPDGDFVVQVGVFSKVEKARARVRELVDLGYPAFLVKRESKGQTRVRIGYFSKHEDAGHFGQRFVRDHGGEYWIDRRSPGGGQ